MIHAENKIEHDVSLIQEDTLYAFKCDLGYWHFGCEKIAGAMRSCGVAWEMDQVKAFLPMSDVIRLIEPEWREP